jgi:hypothetical protein
VPFVCRNAPNEIVSLSANADGLLIFNSLLDSIYKKKASVSIVVAGS